MSGIGTTRLPAEWEPAEAILMAWPHKDTDWLYILDRAEQCFTAMAEAIAPFARLIVIAPDINHVAGCLRRIPADRLTLIPYRTNDTWTRDYGPITIADPKGNLIPLDFGFNGWGLKFAADRDNMATEALESFGLFANAPRNCRGFILEGGSIESDGKGFILTTDSCILSPNRNGGMTGEQILSRIAEDFGAHSVVSLRHGHLVGDDTDGHIDTLARIVPPGDTIIYTGCADPADEHYASLKEMEKELRRLRTSQGKPFNLAELPLPDAMFDSEGNRLPATYANFLIVNGAVIVPTYNQPLKDKMAADIIGSVMDGYEIVTVDCSVLVEQHGSLHCSTMQIPKNTLAI